MLFRWIYLPPLLIYLSAGVSGLTGIVGIFFLKDYLNLSAAFIASIGFWAGIPWALKMPIGFIVDKFWKNKNLLVLVGALVIFKSLLIMFFLITNRELMEQYLPAETWFILSSILTPIGYVIQDVVADAMTIEAVESEGNKSNAFKVSKRNEHMLLQLYGRFSIILGSLLVGLLNIYFFSGVKNMPKTQVLEAYSNVYFLSLFIPLLSISGVILSSVLKKKFELKFNKPSEGNKLDLRIFLASIFFVFFAILFGSLKFPFSQEFVLISSLTLIFFFNEIFSKTINKRKKTYYNWYGNNNICLQVNTRSRIRSYLV